MEADIIKKLNSSSRLVGTKQVLRGLSEGTVRCVIVAADADSFIKNRIVEQASLHKANVEWYSSMEKLGKLCNIDVKATVVGLME